MASLLRRLSPLMTCVLSGSQSGAHMLVTLLFMHLVLGLALQPKLVCSGRLPLCGGLHRRIVFLAVVRRSGGGAGLDGWSSAEAIALTIVLPVTY